MGDALALFDRLLAANPNDVSALNNSAMLLGELGRTGEALERYDRSLAVKPDGFEALYNKALLLEALGRRDEAFEPASKATQTEPGHEGAQGLLQRLQQRNP